MTVFNLARPVRLSLSGGMSVNAPAGLTFGTGAVATTGFTLSGATSGYTSYAVTYTVTPYPVGSALASTVVVSCYEDPTPTSVPILRGTLTFTAGTTAAQQFQITRTTDGTSSVSITSSLAEIGSPILLTTSAVPAAVGNWTARSQAAGVLAAHDFSEAAELSTFVRSNDTAQGAVPITRVAASIGGYAIRSQAVGTWLTASLARGVPNDTQWAYVANIADIPDLPGGSPYLLLIGSPYTGGMEWVQVIAKDAGNSRAQIRRRQTSDSGSSIWRKNAISAITRANPGVVTCAGHGLANGETVRFSSESAATESWMLVQGMVELRNVRYQARVLDANTFVLQTYPGGVDVDTSAFGALVGTASFNTDYATGVAPFIPGESYIRIGKEPDGSWNRPLGAFAAGDNGRSFDDYGVGKAWTRKTRDWNPASSTRHADFREAYIGARWYWDTGTNPSAPYDSWDPPAGGGVRTTAFEGDEIWIQFRAKVSAARLQQDRYKALFIQNQNGSGNGQIFWQWGAKDYDTRAGAYGNVLVPYTCWGDSTAPAGGTLVPLPSGAAGQSSISSPTNTEIQDAASFPYCQWQYSDNGARQCWRIPADEWVTFMVYFKLGRDNANNGASTPTAPFPGAADATYRSTFKLWAAREGESQWSTITDHDKFLWFFGDGKGNWGEPNYYYNPPGLNSLWLTENWNSYAQSSGGAPPSMTVQTDYAQVIISKSEIAIPDDRPTYMQGMTAYQTRALSTVSNGYTTFQSSQPAEWQSSAAPAGSRGVIAAWCGGAADLANLRLYFSGGGHSDGANNGVHLFDFSGDARPVGFSTLSGSRSALADVLDNGVVGGAWTGVYADGRPTAQHTYSTMVYDSVRRRVWKGGGAVYSTGSPSYSHYWYFDLDTGTWNIGVNDGAGGTAVYGCALKAPDESQILMLGGFDDTYFVTLATNARSANKNSPGPSWGSSTDHNPVAAYDSTRDRYLVIARTSGAPTYWMDTYTVDWSAQTYAITNRTATGSAGDIAEIKGGMGLLYDKVHDCFWGVGSRDQMASGSIDKLVRIDAATFAVTTHSLSPAITVGTYSRGTNNRILWMPQYRTIGMVVDYDKPAYLIRLPG